MLGNPPKLKQVASFIDWNTGKAAFSCGRKVRAANFHFHRNVRAIIREKYVKSISMKCSANKSTVFRGHLVLITY